jgi:putative tryptophan/tyrosine transport system substrate-binding protein
MRRRDFLATIGGATISSFGAQAQNTTHSHRIGLFTAGLPLTDNNWQAAPILRGLAARGYVQGRNLVIERRATEGRFDLLPQFATELADRVDVIVAFGFPAAASAKAAGKVPIVVFGTGDPVGTGLAVSLMRPGGKVTGISDVAAELAPKRLSLLKEAVPGLNRVAIIWNERDPGMKLRYDASAAKAKELGIVVAPLPVRAADDFDQVMAAMTEQPPDGLFVVADGLTVLNRKRILDFAEAKRLPAMFEFNFIVQEGGLMSYGPDLEDTFNRVATLIDRLLKGASPESLPFEQPTRFHLALNQETAAKIGLKLPYSLLVQADEVID